MEPVWSALGKFFGAPWLWNVATLAVLIQAVRIFDKIKKIPEDALSKKVFDAHREKDHEFRSAVDVRFATLEAATSAMAGRVHTLWKKAAMSDPYRRALDLPAKAIAVAVEPDPWPSDRPRPPERPSRPDGAPSGGTGGSRRALTGWKTPIPRREEDERSENARDAKKPPPSSDPDDGEGPFE